jgi:5-methylcytosine-specific restriction enzyme A
MADGSRRAPDWEWEEIVLVCDLVERNGWRQLVEGSPQVAELSEMLRNMSIHPSDVRGDKFRNANGVVRKSADIATAHPGYAGRVTNGGQTTKDVIGRFIAEPDVMHALAESIRSSVSDGEPIGLPFDLGSGDESVVEGRYLLRLHAYRERNQGLRRKKINSVLAKGGVLACEVCEFDFAGYYGDRGHGFIECHHVEPLHVGGEAPRTVRDLALLCSNCHRMIHTRPPWPTPDQLRAIIRAEGDRRN